VANRSLLRRRIEKAAGWVSLLAGAIHGLAGPAHFNEWWGYGLFFVFAATAQALLGLALLTDAINERDSGAGWLRAKARLYWAGILGNLAIMALYIVTRTRGVPLGPERGTVEPIAALDAASKAAEVVLVALLAWLLFYDWEPKNRS
jgi:hypothetical protein